MFIGLLFLLFTSLFFPKNSERNSRKEEVYLNLSEIFPLVYHNIKKKKEPSEKVIKMIEHHSWPHT